MSQPWSGVPSNAPKKGPGYFSPYIQSGWIRPKIKVQAGAGLLHDKVVGGGYKKKTAKRKKK